jgi:phosphatidylserine decarboxylase
MIHPRRSLIDRIFQQEDLNFILTNRIPRRLATRLAGWFCEIEQPLVRDASIGVWKLFAGDPQLHEARKSTFDSLHDCFIRELKDGARPVDAAPGLLVSPCDGIVGPCGRIEGSTLIQAKRSTYTLADLLIDPELASAYRDGVYVTLRLTASMYHRFHAPDDCEVREVRHVAGDHWNVNPIALRRVPRLFCRNERVVVPARLQATGEMVTLVAVGAILVAGIHLNFADLTLNMHYRGPSRIACRATLARGEEMGYFRHGSTILVIAGRNRSPAPNLHEGHTVRMGEPLLRSIS